MLKNKFKLPKTFRTVILRTTNIQPPTALNPPRIRATRRYRLNSTTNIFCLLLIAYCLLAFTNSTYPTIRYVSHEGSNTPPYLTWETAADSIMFAINISVFGDTIYVANGVYEEQVVMIPGLALIGAGLDSCVIDTRQLVTVWNDVSVEVADSCLLKGFKIIVSNSILAGMGIAGAGSKNTLVTLNRITNARFGIFLDATFYVVADIIVYNNICDNIRKGIEIFNSNSVIRRNYIHVPPSSNSLDGIKIGAFDFNYTPIIDSNYIVVEGLSFTAADGIDKSFGANPTIANNVIYLKGPQNEGIRLGSSDSGKVFNNLIFSETGKRGIYNFGIQYLQLYNNYATGNFGDQKYAIEVGPDNVVKNNVVTNVKKGVRAWGNENLVFKYNDIWNNDVNYSGFTPDSTNLSADPMIMNEDTTQGELDFHLQMFSPLIDAGDPNISDVDGTRSDIGLYGGLFGERYKYLDLAPKPPRNLSAVIDSEYITLSWNRNTEADFKSYNLFRDTTANFTADSTTLVITLTDTFYQHLIPPKIDAFFYKLTATDKQGNESQPSEELGVIITSINEYPAVVSNYQLYQNYPNPFNPSTKIAYKLKERGYVKLYVYDIKGELVSVLVNETQNAGYYEVEFFGEVGSESASGGAVGNRLASGIYIYQIMVKSENNIPVFTDMKKMVYLK